MKEGKVFKRILAIALVVVMTITMVPFGVFAAEDATPCTHNTGEHTVIARVEPTCTTDGHYRYYQCKCGVYFNRCNETTNQLTEVIEDPTTFGVISNLGGHTWDDGEVTTTAKCDTKGVKTFKCTVEGCDGTKTEEVDALGHDLVNVEKKDPTCKETGYNAYQKCNRADCTYKKDYKELAKVPHDVNGVEFAEYDDVYHTKKCKECSTDVDYTKHTFGEAVETKAPTCVDKGEKTSTCVCGAESKTEIPAKGHRWQSGWCKDCGEGCEHNWNGNVCTICGYTCVNHISNDATCQDEAICGICGNKVADKDPTNHATEETYIKNKKEAKCNNPGYTGDEYYYCCDGLKKAGEVITVDHVYDTTLTKISDEKHGYKCTNEGCTAFDTTKTADHKFEVDEIKTNPTCFAEGKAIFKCEDCGAVREGKLDKVEHKYATTVSKKDDNTHGKKCTNEGCTDYDAVENHDWELDSTTTPATCTADGVGVYKCKDCEATKDGKIDKLNHDTTGVKIEKIDATEHGKKCKTCNNFVEKAEHAYTEDGGKVVPTCITKGSETKKCVCGDTKTTELDKNDNHTFGTWNIITNATCTTDGKKERSCTRTSGDVTCTHKEEEVIPATGHDLVKVPAVAATCQADGNNEYYDCSKCDAVFKADKTTATTVAAEKIAKGEHSFTNYVYNVNSETCTADGTETAKCDNCDETHTRYKVGTQVAHLFKNYVADGNATCIADGTKTAVCETCKEAKDTVEDKGSMATAAHKPDSTGKKCELCNAELVCTHTYSQEKLITTTPTCTTAGEQAYVCSKCNAKKPGSEEVLPATGHAWDDGEVIKAASCKETGSTKYKCNNMCGETKTEEVAKTAHNYREDITHATCTEDGYSTFTCTMCGSYYVDKAVTAYGHMFETYFYDEGSATCYQDGTKTAECANGCGAKNTVADPGSKTDHEMTDFTVITEATCTTDGEEEAKCFYHEHCGYSELVPVYALGHDESGNFETTVPATCTEKGTEVKKCVRCEEVIATQEIPALGHDESGELVEVLAATCTAEGSKEKKCVRCSEVVATEAIPALGHDIAADYTIDVAATCLTAGKQSKHCSRCDYKDGEVEIPATGHDMQATDESTATCTEPGKAVFACANGCGETKTEPNSPALGHDFAYVSNGDATCTADGTKTGKCKRCDETHTADDVGSKLDHVMAEPVIVKATKENGGLITNKCANCEYEEVEEIAKIDSLKLKYTTVVYDGKYKRPSLTITDADGAKLIKGEDYLLELPAKEDCINAGTYTYKVTFIGNYEGEETLTYKVVPGKASKIVSKDTKQTYISLKWSTVKGADGYRIYVKTSSGSWKKLATVKGTTSYKVKDLKAGTKYTFAVKAFSKSEDGKTTIWASEFAEQTFKTLPGKTSSLTAKTSKNAVKLTWKAVTGADGYRVYVKTAKGGWKTVSTVKGKTTYTVKDLKANTTYEYAVKAYYKDGSANIWSNQYKTVKAKTAK